VRRTERIHRQHRRGLLLAERVDVGAERGERGAILLHERRLCRAARQRFEAEGAGAGKDVEHARPLAGRAVGEATVGENVEQRFARAVAGRAHGAALRRRQGSAAVLTADDPHGDA
jgi:hypothetical protein